MKKFYSVLVLIPCLITPKILATSRENAPVKIEQERVMADKARKYESIINDYKEYLAKVPEAVREEIKNYRVQIAKLNNEKKEAYRRLSIETQNYLKKEREFKKQLPLKIRNQMLTDQQKQAERDLINSMQQDLQEKKN